MQNENGERLCEFSQQNGLVIAGTLFPHKDIHKITWISLDGNTKSQLDHLMISGRWRSSLLDSRAQRSADAGSGNYLVRTRIKLRLNTHRNNKKTSPRFDVDRLKDEMVKMKFRVTLRKKLEENRVEEEDIEEMWDKQRDAYVKTAEEVLGYRKGKIKSQAMDTREILELK